MQRRLVLVRHAPAADALVDVDRPLTDRGTRRAAAIGAWLQRAGISPDRVLVSEARRAVQTWEQTGQDVPAVLDPRIYDNTIEALLTAIRDNPESVRELVVVGHNPSIGALSTLLDDGQGDLAARRDAEAGFPAGAVAVFTLGTPFAEVAPGTARLTDFTVPGA